MSALICVAGGKGAPGATTLALALALSGGTDRPVTLIDADPDGGDLAARLGIPTTPGLVTRAAATRHGFDSVETPHHTQAVTPTVGLIAAPSSAEQAATSLTSLGRTFAEITAGSATVADVGRWGPHSPASDLVAEAAATVLVIHPTVAGVAHARYQLDDLSKRSRRVVVACAGDRPHSADEVAAALDIDIAFALPIDRRGAALLGASPGAHRWLRRTALMRAVRSLNELLAVAKAPA